MVKLRTIFFGNNTPQLETLLENTEVKAIFTKESDTDLNVQKILKIAEHNKIPIYYPKSIKLEKDRTSYNIINQINPDIIISGGYHLIIPQEIIDIPKYKTINIHPALLPKYRGAHVIQWQIINDEKETGTTLHYMTKNLDDGDIIRQTRVPLKDEDDAWTIWQKTSAKGSELLKEVIGDIEKTEHLESYTQKGLEATIYHKRSPEDGRIEWDKTGRQIYNLTRALVNPWPGAFFDYNNYRYIINKVKIETDKNIKLPLGTIPGTVYRVNNQKLSVVTGDGLIHINKMDIREYNGTFKEFLDGMYIGK
jgi:methionyl-tRNA formyltransferase